MRKALDLGGTVRYTGTYAYRGLLPMDKAVAICEEDVRLPKMWLGDQKVRPSAHLGNIPG